MKKVLLTQKIHEEAISLLKKHKVEVIISPSPDDKIVRKYIIDVDGIIVRTTTKLSMDTIFSAKKLKVISRTGAGVDNIDVSSASEKGIPICYTPEANIESVSEQTVAFILALAKNMLVMDRAVRDNNFNIRNDYLQIDLFKKVLGIVGFGKIGRTVAKKCYSAFNMSIFAYDPYLSKEVNVNFPFSLAKNIEEIFKESDFITIHIPYTKNNNSLINGILLGKMKKKAFLINTSRGGIVNEEALAYILSKNKIAGAALDVFEDEPPKEDNPLLKLKNIILTPHSAALTNESAKRVALQAAEGVLDILEGKIPKWIYNKDEIFI